MLDIKRSLYFLENRKSYEFDDDFAVLFYKGTAVAKGYTEKFRKNWQEESSYSDNMYDFFEDLGYDLEVELDEEDINDNWEHIWDELDWDDDSRSFKYGNWELVVLDI